MRPLFPAAFLLITLCLPLSASPQKKPTPSPYWLQYKPAKEGFATVSLWSRRPRRVLWKRLMSDNGVKYRNVNWARNRRALVIEQGGTLLVWHAGKPLREIGAASVPESGGKDHYDYTMGSEWSPDARRLLVGFGISGMGDVGISRLFCLTFRGNRYKYTVAPSSDYIRAGEMGWRSDRVAFYRPAIGVGGQTTGKTRLWRVP